MSIAAFTLKSTTTQSAAPFSIGHAFKRGDVPAGQGVVGSISDLQVTAKTTWPDGSLKFAMISGRAALTANVAATITLSIGTPTAGTALTTADLKATSITASISAGAFGSASWATTDWDSPWVTWASGPKMSSWVFRKQIGVDAHLVGFLEVRLWSGGEVEVLPWVENGYAFVAGPTNKSDTYGFTLSGSPVFSAAIDLKSHQRTVLISGSMLAYWLGTDPGLIVRHDATYLQATEQVPTYRAVVSNADAIITGLVDTFTPLQMGNIAYDADSMQSTGYQAPIGLLPQHDVVYLTASADKIYNSVVRNGYSAGRYGLHYRHETTNLPVKFRDFPTMVWGASGGLKDTGASTTNTRTPTITGGQPVQWDTAHSPSVGYMAYLLTGRQYFKDEVQFAAVANHFNVTDWLRSGAYTGGANLTGFTGASGICTTAIQTRSGAWWLRSLTQALNVTPDTGDSLRAELIFAVEENCRYWSKYYVEQANNTFGVVFPGQNYGSIAGVFSEAAWQQDFITGAWGFAQAMGLPISATAASKMSAFFNWKAKLAVGRLGASTDFWYINGDPYVMAVAPNPTTDWLGGTGPWYPTFKAAYDATYASPPPWLGSTEGVLVGEDGSPTAYVAAMWGNLQPAIAYAVRFGVAGALAGYNRMIGATNWSSFQTAFNAKPVWSVSPASAQTTTTTGPFMRADSTSLISGMFVAGVGGLGVRAADIPSSGSAGAGILYNDTLTSGTTSTDEFRALILTKPSVSGATITFAEDGSFIALNFPDGAYSGTYEGYKNGVSYGTSTYSFAIGSGDITAPTLSLPTGTATGSTTASGSVATDEANGTLFFLASQSAIESAANVKAAGSQLVVTLTVQNVTFGSLLPSTTYYAHYLHRDAAGNESAVANSSSFTTSASGSTGRAFRIYLNMIGAPRV